MCCGLSITRKWPRPHSAHFRLKHVTLGAGNDCRRMRKRNKRGAARLPGAGSENPETVATTYDLEGKDSQAPLTRATALGSRPKRVSNVDCGLVVDWK